MKKPRNQDKVLGLEQGGSTNFLSCHQGIEGFLKRNRDRTGSQSFVNINSERYRWTSDESIICPLHSITVIVSIYDLLQI